MRRRTHGDHEGLATEAGPFLSPIDKKVMALEWTERARERGKVVNGIQRGRCGNASMPMVGSGRPRAICDLTWGHGGWHRGDDGSEWTHGDAESKTGTLLDIVTAAIEAGVSEFSVTDSGGRSYDITLGERRRKGSKDE